MTDATQTTQDNAAVAGTLANANQHKVEALFSFRKNAQTGEKRPSLTLSYNALTAVGIIAALQSGDENVVTLVEDTIAGLSQSQLRSFVDADPAYDQSKADADADKLTLQYIANLPRAERNTVGKEDLQQFAEAYIAFMPGFTGKSLEKVQTAAALFVERFKRVAGENNVLSILQDQLGIFVENADTEIVEANGKAITYLMEKLKELLEIKVTVDAL